MEVFLPLHGQGWVWCHPSDQCDSAVAQRGAEWQERLHDDPWPHQLHQTGDRRVLLGGWITWVEVFRPCCSQQAERFGHLRLSLSLSLSPCDVILDRQHNWLPAWPRRWYARLETLVLPSQKVWCVSQSFPPKWSWPIFHPRINVEVLGIMPLDFRQSQKVWKNGQTAQDCHFWLDMCLWQTFVVLKILQLFPERFV